MYDIDLALQLVLESAKIVDNQWGDSAFGFGDNSGRISGGIVYYDAAKSVPAPRRGERADGVQVDEV
jgi:hypothetical protein